MTVELIQAPAAGEILDLTGGSNEPEVKDETVTDEESTPDTKVETDVAEDGTTETADGESDSDTDGADTGDTDGESDAESDVEGEFFFAGQAVNVDVPDEIGTALADAGVDKKELLTALFAKDGDFSLPDEMRGKLEEKFGKLMVDGYLNMYKGMNEQAMSKAAEAQASAEAELKAQGEAYATAVGGEEGLVKMEDFIVKNFNEDQIAAYNAVMENGDHASQMLIISQVTREMELMDKLQNGDKKVNLVGDKDATSSGVASPLDKGYLSNAEYNEIMAGDKYWEDREYMAKVDAARMAGFKHDA